MDIEVKVVFWLAVAFLAVVVLGMRCSAYAECKRAGHTDNYCAVTVW